MTTYRGAIGLLKLLITCQPAGSPQSSGSVFRHGELLITDSVVSLQDAQPTRLGLLVTRKFSLRAAWLARMIDGGCIASM
jgi:hypothetical protein